MNGVGTPIKASGACAHPCQTGTAPSRDSVARLPPPLAPGPVTRKNHQRDPGHRLRGGPVCNRVGLFHWRIGGRGGHGRRDIGPFFLLLLFLRCGPRGNLHCLWLYLLRVGPEKNVQPVDGDVWPTDAENIESRSFPGGLAGGRLLNGRFPPRRQRLLRPSHPPGRWCAQGGEFANGDSAQDRVSQPQPSLRVPLRPGPQRK